ncbi:MAG: GTP 3',8-cyclase MoaA [Desulfobacterales bacterium]|nr:GTP 3',8-cyclase MoaA [Desulfobacterales bacterium]MCP4159958.1 GTP 3',8-cyclase MoaA [Deltaproteobacteria bacterium]
MEILTDSHNRVLNYLRLSLTDRCNLRCFYCVNDSVKFIPHNQILRYEEILRLVRLSVGLGVSKIRITGGEPLLRAGVYDFLNKLSEIEGIKDLSLTTNGIYLKENLDKIIGAGINRLNISLDTLTPERYKITTGKDLFGKVWDSIMAAHDKGINPLKINVVAIRNLNFDELTSFAELTFKYPFHIRFIEYMPMGEDINGNLLTPEIRSRIESVGQLHEVESGSGDGPAERFKFKGAKGEIGFISPISKHFCSNCNRLRLTASGMLRPCLLSDHKINIIKPLRDGLSDDELTKVFLKAASFKQKKHLLDSSPDKIVSKMHSIGG